MSNILVKQFYKQRSDFEKSCAGRNSNYTFPEGVICTSDILFLINLS